MRELSAKIKKLFVKHIMRMFSDFYAYFLVRFRFKIALFFVHIKKYVFLQYCKGRHRVRLRSCNSFVDFRIALLKETLLFNTNNLVVSPFVCELSAKIKNINTVSRKIKLLHLPHQLLPLLMQPFSLFLVLQALLPNRLIGFRLSDFLLIGVFWYWGIILFI